MSGYLGLEGKRAPVTGYAVADPGADEPQGHGDRRSYRQGVRVT